LYIKYILSILILSNTLFSSNIEVIESFNNQNKKNLIQKNRNYKRSTEYITPKVKNNKKVKAITLKETNIKQSSKIEKQKAMNNHKVKRKKNVTLAIIIDDVSNRKQLRELQSLPFKHHPHQNI